jgi:hypothetical protein
MELDHQAFQSRAATLVDVNTFGSAGNVPRRELEERECDEADDQRQDQADENLDQRETGLRAV